ncbi:MAG: hypothetical protein IAE82_14220 [Opitutaceae bacterium]|nr:hypothetical protein [Opitutaceae bacterium]
MLRRPTFLLLVLVSAGALAGSGVARAALSPESVDAAHLLALGRLPDAAERERTSTADHPTFAHLVNELGQSVRRDKALAAATDARARRDALGTTEAQAGSAEVASGGLDYTSRLRRHLDHLKADPAAYRAVIDRAYHRVVQRTPYDIEYDYWAARDPLPFFLLCACIENWAVRNQPGLMSTTGTPSIDTNSRHLTAVRVPPTVADDVRTVLGRPARAEDPHGLASGRVVLSAGASAVVSIGGIHVVAVGAEARP